MNYIKSKWLIALAAISIHVCIGSVYAWSVFSKPVMKELSVSLSDVSWAFSLAIFFLGMSAAFLGKYVEKYGPQVSGMVAAIFFATGFFGSGMAMAMHSIWMLYLFYGVFGGIGLGLGYITPVSTLVKWFPDKKGLATGLAIMGFGLAAMIAAPLIQWLISAAGLEYCFYALGIVYFFVIACAASCLEPPAIELTGFFNNSDSVKRADFTAQEAMHDWRFYVLWFVFFINITCGIGILAVASPMAQDLVGMTATSAAIMVGIVGLVNGAGRLGWSSFSDYFGRINTFALFFALETICYTILAFTSSVFVFQLCLFVIVSCYGGAFAAMPAFLSDIFGTEHLGTIHGRILSAWAMAGIAGPLIISAASEEIDGYFVALLLFGGAMIVALTTILAMKMVKKY